MGHVVIAAVFGCIGLLAVPIWKLFGPRDFSLPVPSAEIQGSDRAGQTAAAGSSPDPVQRILGQIPNSMPARPATPPVPTVPAQPFPDNGAVLAFQQLPDGQTATFTVDATASGSGLNIVKLEEWNTQRPVLVTFVRGGAISSINVPLGVYRVKMAGGEAWYGLDDLFGPSTNVKVGDKPLQFYASGNTIMGHTLHLHGVQNGNFPTSKGGRQKF
ncbi:hypothetical protein PO002_42005 [Cupriavidus necator]|uniref:hypothetical protein n=1 Tax=Cupriavidus necator TaxID=106590 RepID=UPI0039C2B791